MKKVILFTLMFILITGAVFPIASAVASAPAIELVSASHPKKVATVKPAVKPVVKKVKKPVKKKEKLILNPPLIDPNHAPGSY